MSSSRRGSSQASVTWVMRATIGFLFGLVLFLLVDPRRNTHVSNSRLNTSSSGNDRAQEIIQRFHHAKAYVKRMKDIGKNELFTLTECPERFSIGFRTTPGQIIPQFVGNTCEPWIARFALIFLDRLLDTEMKGLEWSTGSSTQWVLMRVKSLISIEHHAKWSTNVAAALARIFPEKFLSDRWQLHAIEPLPGTKEKGPDKEDPVKFKDYIEASFLPLEGGMYDYISVDGRARVPCFKRALPLLKPEGGILLLDNSERVQYADAFAVVPKHWLRFDDLVNTQERTTIWVSCVEGRCGQEVESSSSDS